MGLPFLKNLKNLPFMCTIFYLEEKFTCKDKNNIGD